MITHRHNLPKLLKDLNLPMTGAEIGVAEGYFANDLLTGGVTKLYMVDAWRTLDTTGDGASPQSWHDKNYSDALARVAVHGDKSVILRGITWEMAYQVENNSLGFVYLDAGHSYECVMADLKAWVPKVVKGGIVAGHDFLNRSYGVERAVREFAKTEIYTINENKTEDAGFLFIC